MSATLKRGSLLLALLLSPFCAWAQPASANDRIDARRVADEIGRASERMDVAGIMRHLARDAQFHVGGKRMDAASYEQHLRRTFPQMSGYTYTRSGESVQAGRGGDVVLSFRLQEEYTHNGKRRSATTQQTYHLRREGGVLKVYKVEAR